SGPDGAGRSAAGAPPIHQARGRRPRRHPVHQLVGGRAAAADPGDPQGREHPDGRRDGPLRRKGRHGGSAARGQQGALRRQPRRGAANPLAAQLAPPQAGENRRRRRRRQEMIRMLAFRHLSIKRKLMWLATLTSGTALLLISAGLVTYEYIAFPKVIARKLSIQARITGANSFSALLFNDPRAATETLAALR